MQVKTAILVLVIAIWITSGCVAQDNSAAPPPAPSTLQSAPAAPVISPEVRGLWVVRNSIETPDSIRNVVAMAKAHHFNALFVQVRGRGDAYYNSTLEPRAEELAGQPLSFDPLQCTIDAAHAAGLQVHAWVNTFYVWGDAHLPLAANHIVNAHPDWLARDSHNQYQTNGGPGCEGAFLSPANPAARQHIHDVVMEIARDYDVDGIHFDYIRYPNGSYDYSTASLTGFRQEMDAEVTDRQRAWLQRAVKHDRLAYVHAFPEEFQDFRRDQVTALVRDISHDVKQIKPWMIISAAVFADYADAYKSRGQDWKLWLREGYLDAVAPMAYGESTALVASQVADAVSCAQGAHRMVFAGIGSWHIPAASTVAKIAAARTLRADGEILFSYGGMTKDGTTTAYMDKVGQTCYPSDAPLPSMPWLPARPASTSAQAATPPSMHAGG